MPGRKFDRAQVQYSRALPRKLEHFLEAHLRQAARLRNHARVGRVDAIDVGQDLAFVGLQHDRERDGRRIGTAAPDRRDVPVRRAALETCDDGHDAVREILAELVAVDALDARAACGPGRLDRKLQRIV